jgi:thymidine kinase
VAIEDGFVNFTHIKNTILFYRTVRMSLSIIMGNMFSGKTSELIRRLKRLKILEKRIVVVNSAKDTRSPEQVLKTHDNVKFDCYKVLDLYELLNKDAFEDAEIVAIDEAQFFPNLKKFVECCLDMGKDVIIAGLDADAFQRKWGEILDCVPIACEVTKLSALCKYCRSGRPGPFTKRIVDNSDLELIGGSDMYVAVCRKHL